MDWFRGKRWVIYAGLALLVPLALLQLPRPTPSPTPDLSPRREPDEGSEAPAGTRPPPPTGRQHWTLAEAQTALSRQPDNTYLQYVVLTLGRQEGKLDEVLRASPRLQRERPVDLFSLFSGRLAIQESLQLDALLPAGAAGREPATPEATPSFPNTARAERGAAAAAPAGTVPIARLHGPTVRSHPWDKLLAGRSPRVSPLALCVPDDFYLAEFRTPRTLHDVLTSGRLWLDYAATQGARESVDLHTRRRLEAQLALDQVASLDVTVGRIAVAGSDLFVRQGSDVTVLMQVTRPTEYFQRNFVERALERAAQAHPDARRRTGKLLGVDYVALTTADRRLNVYAATPRPDLHLRSNSLVALRRILEAIAGHDDTGRPVCRLGASAEFRYIRTLMPTGAAEEDGFLYLSDAFVRHMVSPRLKLTERRRLIGASQLQMIAHAAQLYRSQYRRAPRSLDDLDRAGLTPIPFNKGSLACPFGGTYTLNADGTAGVSTVLNDANFLTPCCELLLDEVTADEARDYRDFVRDYERYWSTYFDPIAVRVQQTPHRLRIETVVLPLIENTLYRSLAGMLGGAPEPLEPLPVPPRNLFTLNLRLRKEALLQELLAAPIGTATARACLTVGLVCAPAGPGSLAPLVWTGAARAKLEPTEGEFARRLKAAGIPPAKVRRFVQEGLGHQAGLHFYDTGLTFDVNYSALLGRLIAQGGARDGGHPLDALTEIGLPAFAVSSLAAPVYIAVPVRDRRIVDEFLDLLDPVFAQAPTWREGGVLGFGAQGDFYHLRTGADLKVRALGVRVGPLRWRCFYARIGDGLYIANQPGVLEDLRAAELRRLQQGSAERGPAGHAMMRLRPAHWQQALTGYRLAWAEDNRAACLRNVEMLTAAARAFGTTPPVTRRATNHDERRRLVLEYAAQMYGGECKCPDGGRYELAPDGLSFRCSVHGGWDEPRQALAPSEYSPAVRALRGLSEATATLTFTPEGLRAVVVIDRR